MVVVKFFNAYIYDHITEIGEVEDANIMPRAGDYIKMYNKGHAVAVEVKRIVFDYERQVVAVYVEDYRTLSLGVQ